MGRDEIEALKTKYFNQFFMKNWEQEFSKFEDFVKGTGKAIDAEAAGKKDIEFGASAIVGGPMMAIKRALERGHFEEALDLAKDWANKETELSRAVEKGDIQTIAKLLGTDEQGAQRYLDSLAKGKPFDMMDSHSMLHGSDVKAPEEGKQKPQVREEKNENISNR